jgi:hypothetical protein
MTPTNIDVSGGPGLPQLPAPVRVTKHRYADAQIASWVYGLARERAAIPAFAEIAARPARAAVTTHPGSETVRRTRRLQPGFGEFASRGCKRAAINARSWSSTPICESSYRSRR